MLDRLGLAAEAFGDFGQFMRLFHARPGFWGGIEWGSPRPEVPWLLRRVMLRRLRSDVLPQLPPKRYETLVVGLDGSLRGELDEAWREWDRLRPGREELPPFEAFSAVRRRLAESRIKAALEQVEGFEEAAEPLVVFSAHREPAVQIGARTGWGIITGDTDPPRRQEVVEEFQAGRLKGVALTIGAGGLGLTLTRAPTVLFIDLDWVPANNLQAEDRVCRIGQEAEGIRVIRMVSDHALDRHLLRVLDRKAGLAHSAVERPAL